MFDPGQYELIDFGEGRKLERFGEICLDRPCPAAEDSEQRDRLQWQQASACYRRTNGDKGIWKPAKTVAKPWTIRHGKIVFQLKPTQFGHLGVFPEQAANWDWIDRKIQTAGRPLKILNLFAYTGGSTLAAALAGAEQVVHVDAARNVVAWARENATLSGLNEAPIRWITEDVMKFVQRELKRGNQYDAVILDPPTYGHGPNNEVWKIGRDLGPLLIACNQLTQDRRAFVLLTCHSSGYGPAEVQSMATDIFFGSCSAPVPIRSMHLETSAGQRLDAGLAAKIS